jgi:hypothetical protein
MKLSKMFLVVPLAILIFTDGALAQSLLEKTSVSGRFDSISRATEIVIPRKIDPRQLSNKSAAKSSLLYDREKVEVLARSVTFPEVLTQGELMTRVDFPNTAVFCLDAALYAGRVEGLILAMDRDTVVEHRLYWTIDAADDLYYACLTNLVGQAFAGQYGNDRNQLKDIKEDLTGQIQGIQKALRYARNVKIKDAAQKFACSR